MEPPIDLVLPSLPPIVDPAESIAATLRQEADARALNALRDEQDRKADISNTDAKA
jgi:hypothetical protein